MSEALKKIADFRRAVLRDLYSQCTQAQQNIFNLMYKSLEDVSDKQIDWAIEQCERTIIKNKKKSQGQRLDSNPENETLRDING